MTKEELLEILEIYGDHRWSCPISRKIRGEWPYSANKEYPSCVCGWEAIRRQLKLALEGG